MFGINGARTFLQICFPTMTQLHKKQEEGKNQSIYLSIGCFDKMLWQLACFSLVFAKRNILNEMKWNKDKW